MLDSPYSEIPMHVRMLPCVHVKRRLPGHSENMRASYVRLTAAARSLPPEVRRPVTQRCPA